MNICQDQCPEGFAWGKPFLGKHYGCFDIDECNENVHQCTDPFRCLNKIGSYVCSCPYKVYKLQDGKLICRKPTSFLDDLRKSVEKKQNQEKEEEEPVANCTNTDGHKTCNPEKS